MKVAYIGDWHPTKGTYYRQRITVTQDEYDMLNRKMIEQYSKNEAAIKETRVMSGTQMELRAYGKPLDFADRVGQTIYLTLTQLWMIVSAISGVPGFEKAFERITDNNTILMIKG